MVRARSNLTLRARALRLLALREHSRGELERKLSRYLAEEDSPAELSALLDALEAAGWLSDERFAQLWVARRAERFGPLRLRQDLAVRGVAEGVSQAATAALGASDHERALALWQRRFGGEVATDRAERARQMRFLIQRGFHAAMANRIVHGQGPR